jgi:hypothetical protein
MAIDGKWNLTIKTPLGDRSSTLEVASAAGKLTGAQTAGGDDSSAIENGAIKGNEASWSVDITSPMPMTLTFNGAVAGDTLSGTVQLGPYGESTFSGERG